MIDAYDSMLSRLSSCDGWAKADEAVRLYPLTTSIEKPGLTCTQAVLEPYTYVISNKGKEIRAQIIEAFNVWLKVPMEKLEAIGRIVSMLHSASLLYVHFLMAHYRIAERSAESTILRMTQICDVVPPVWHFITVVVKIKQLMDGMQSRIRFLACPKLSTLPTACASSRTKNCFL